jgi:hypothetical protein
MTADVSRDLAVLADWDDEDARLRRDIAWKSPVTERNVALGLQGECDLIELRQRKLPARPVAGTEPLAGLLRHMREHYSPVQLRNDLDCVLSLCGSEADRKEVRKFARALQRGKPYEGAVNLDPKVCESCRRPFSPRRSSARFCSATCRKRGSRRNQGVHVTLSPSPAP